MKKLRFILLIFLACLTACAYQIGNRKKSLPGGYTKIAVPIFTNSTDEVGAEVYFTNSIIEELIRSQKTEVMKQGMSEVVLEGDIIRIEVVGKGTTSSTNLPQYTELYPNYQLLVDVHLKLRRVLDQKVIWDTTVSGERTFAAAKVGGLATSGTDAKLSLSLNSANPLYNHSALHENLKVMASDLMEQAYSRLTETF